MPVLLLNPDKKTKQEVIAEVFEKFTVLALSSTGSAGGFDTLAHNYV